MPEQNFEQQARNMAEGFSVEPNAAVWQHVEKVIAKKTRKKRVIFWWLLPLVIAGGSAILLFTGNKKSSQNIVQSAVKKEQHKESKKTKVASSDQKIKTLPAQNNKTKYTQKEGKNIPVLSYQKSKKRKTKKDEEILALNSDQPVDSESNFKERNEPIASNQTSTDSTHQTKNNEQQKALDTATKKTKVDTILSDSSSQKKDTTSQFAKLKKQNNKSWHWGFVAEAGLTSWGNNPFQTAPMPSSYATIPQSNWDNLNNGVSTGRTSITNHHSEKGASLSVGAAVQKSMSKKIFFGGQLTYRYQPFSVTQIIRKDTATTPSQNNAGFVFYTLEEAQRFHFLNLNANIGWQIVQRKKNSVSLEAGFDNGFLIGLANKKEASAPQADSLKSNSTANNFYRWQPSVNASININFYTGKTSFLQLSPLVRFGLRKFQKNNIDYRENHLTSAGIRLIYFFK